MGLRGNLTSSAAKFLISVAFYRLLATQAFAESDEASPPNTAETAPAQANESAAEVPKDSEIQKADALQEKPMRGKYVSWKSVDGAQYYRGKIRMPDGNLLPFRISTTKILIKSDQEIAEIKAISSGQALVKTISKDSLTVSDEFELSKELAEKLPKFGKAKSPAKREGSDESRKNLDEASTATKSSTEKKSKLSDSKSKPDKTAEILSGFAVGSGQVYLVREKLVASGAGSEFAGVSHSLGVRLAYEKHSPSGANSSYFYPSLRVRQHVFQLKTTEVDETEEKETTKRIAIPRFGIFGGYNWISPLGDLATLTVGLGLGYSEFIYIKTAGVSSDSGELTSQKSVVIPVDVEVRTGKQTDGDQWLLRSENSLGLSAKGTSMSLEILRQSTIRQDYPVIGGLMVYREKFSKSLDCDFAPGCNSSKSADVQIALKLGVVSVIK